MRIALVSDYYYPQLGGITEHVHGLGTELVRRGHEVTLLTPRMLHVPKTVDGDDVPERPFGLRHVGRSAPFYANGAETSVSLSARPFAALDRAFREGEYD